ncbi:MAG: MgtC/SapB family protein, partial [Flavobacteriales bacterium]
LVCILGYLAAMLATEWGPWMLVAAFIGCALLFTVAYLQSALSGDGGSTSEITAMLLFLLGALSFHGELLVVVVIGVSVLVLLRSKIALHGFVKALTHEEILAIVRFVVISALITPFLPDEGYGPDGVWNPREIWLMVVLVSGISLVGYLLERFFGSRSGAVLSGLLGGLASSTALSLGHARRSRDGSDAVPFLALGIIVACSIMFLRMLAELAVIAPPFAQRMAMPLAIIAACGIAVSLFLARRARKASVPAQRNAYTNPLNFGVALQFAVIYAIVSWVMRYAEGRFGTTGGYVAALLSGATDVDAVTLNLAQQGGPIGPSTMITLLIAALSNTLVKFIIVLSVGAPELRRAVIPGFVALFLASLIAIAWIGGIA